MARHRHVWKEIDRCCAYCFKCDAVKYHGDIVRVGEGE
jgi:hypothetical protein